MELHNTIKGKVISDVNEVFDKLINEKNSNNFCTCYQCRLDVACYVLNRVPPHYIVSHRGASRTQIDGFDKQQHAADISTLVQEGLKRINENLRPHSHHMDNGKADSDSDTPLFYVPTFLGRVFNGNNFEPLTGATVELLRDGELVKMRDGNWRNPVHLVPLVEGNYSFWPAPVKAPEANLLQSLKYTIRVTAKDFEPLTHSFAVELLSEVKKADFFALERKYKLPDMHMFPPGENEEDVFLE